jgi:uncharacterized protein (TIGR02271 family)
MKGIMTSIDDIKQLIGCPAVDCEGSRLGKIGQVYVNDRTGQPLWVTVATGMFGTRQSFAPIRGSRYDGEQLVLAVPKDVIKDAPNIDDDQRIGADEQEALYRHYAGHLSGETAQDAGDQRTDAAGPSAQESYAQSRGTPGSTGEDAMTRSEERLRVGTEGVETGRVRLRKYVVTEDVTTQVPVSHEEVRVEREPVTEASRDTATAGPTLPKQNTRSLFMPSVRWWKRKTVPVERVRLGTEKVTDEHEVSETVRKEQIEEPGPHSDPDRPAR